MEHPSQTSPQSSNHVPNDSHELPYFETLLKEKQVEEIPKELRRDWRVREKERNGLVVKPLESLASTKDSLTRVLEGLEGEKDETFVVKEGVRERLCVESEMGDQESKVLLEEARLVSRLANEVESRVDKYKELRKKEKREWEIGLISLTEENRDVNNLVRIALLEKEALEKRMKGNDHKRMPFLQFAELGWQKVGFGFMMGGGTNEQLIEGSGANTDSSECEEEVVSLVQELFMEIKEAKEEVARWKEASVLEVAAGGNVIEERDKVKTKAALDLSNGKPRLKEELAITAIAAQEAAERSLQLADSRAVELRQWIEELTRQLEEAEKREHNSYKVRSICWPWEVFKLSSSSNIVICKH